MVLGFISTIVISLFMIIKIKADIMPQLNPIKILAMISHNMLGMPLNPLIGWIVNFIIWGIAFFILYNKLPGFPVVKRISFGVIAWLLMMFIPMPMSGEGLFELKLGMMAPIIILVLHIIYGAVIDFTYKLFTTKIDVIEQNIRSWFQRLFVNKAAILLSALNISNYTIFYNRFTKCCFSFILTMVSYFSF